MLRNTKGFTLIELMVVILIIGILAALAIPKFTNASVKAKMSEVPTVIAAFDNAQVARIAETGSIGAVNALVFDAPTNSKWFTWTEPATGQYQAAPIAVIGDMATTDYARSEVFTADSIVHSSNDTLAVSKYLPNFLRNK